jgi:DEAD/DEAH box helicase domain-containing protein
MEFVSRDRARAILEELLAHTGELERVASVSDIYINPNFDSELESRFIEGVRRLSRVADLPAISLVQDIVQGKSGYLVEVEQQRYWVEPQVELGPNEGVKESCKPDFVFWPALSRSSRRPIAVFCDGWSYHQATTREDALKRSALAASGRFWVWSVTWDDVQAALSEKLENTWSDGLEEMYFNPKDGLPQQLRSMFDETFFREHAIALLVRLLAKKPGEHSDLEIARMARHAGAASFRMVPNPTLASLAEARAALERFWEGIKNPACDRPTQSVAAGNVNGLGVTLRYWWPRELADPHGQIPPSPGYVIYNEAHAHDEPSRHMLWRRWLGLFNIFQALPGVWLATQAGLEADDYEALNLATRTRSATGAAPDAHAVVWERVIEQTMKELADGLRALMAAGLPAPDSVGFELETGGEVAAEAELAWTSLKIVLLMPAHSEYRAVWKDNGWTVVTVEGDSQNWQHELEHALGWRKTSTSVP